MNVDRVGVHTSHCCILHGCKYGDEDCPVTNKRAVQEYTCESCDEEGIESVAMAIGASVESDYCSQNIPVVDTFTFSYDSRYHSDLLRELLIGKVALVTPIPSMFKQEVPHFSIVIADCGMYNNRILVKGDDGNWYGEARINLKDPEHLIGRIARVLPEHTDLKPDPGFEIIGVEYHGDEIKVRGEHTYWFGIEKVVLGEET